VVRAVLRWTEFYAHESCGKCTPCREGTYWLVQALLSGSRPAGRRGGLEKLLDICDNINGRAFCALGDGAVQPDHLLDQVLPRGVPRAPATKGAVPFDPARTTVWAPTRPERAI
jgi:NADH-quinone oxidoreductase subunit F